MKPSRTKLGRGRKLIGKLQTPTRANKRTSLANKLLLIMYAVRISQTTCTHTFYPTEIGIAINKNGYYKIPVKIENNSEIMYHGVNESRFEEKQEMSGKLVSDNYIIAPLYPRMTLKIQDTEYEAFPAIGLIRIVQPKNDETNTLNQIRFKGYCNCPVNTVQLRDWGHGKCAYLMTFDKIANSSRAYQILPNGIHNFKAVDFNKVENLTNFLANNDVIVVETVKAEEFYNITTGSFSENCTMTTIDRAPQGKVTVMQIDETKQLNFEAIINRTLIEPQVEIETPKNSSAVEHECPICEITRECPENICKADENAAIEFKSNKAAWILIGTNIFLFLVSISAIAAACYYRRASLRPQTRQALIEAVRPMEPRYEGEPIVIARYL